MLELKPCPFCGSKARFVVSGSVRSRSHSVEIECTNILSCGAKQYFFDTEQEAADAWNRRAFNPQAFSVIDNNTGEYPNLELIALKEDWAKGLIYCDMEGFAVDESGNLVLLDECGNMAYCPPDRFTVVEEESNDADN